jgi:hypothetical protein
MEDKMLTIGDIITDHDEGGTGIVSSVDVRRWTSIMVGSVHIHWIGLGTFATAPEEAMAAIEAGEWTVQRDLKTAWGWTFPRSTK